MGEKFREFKLLRGGEGKVNPKITAYQVELAQVEAEIEKLLDTLTGANATLLAYANKKIEDLDNRRKTLSKAIADLSVETLSSQRLCKNILENLILFPLYQTTCFFLSLVAPCTPLLPYPAANLPDEAFLSQARLNQQIY